MARMLRTALRRSSLPGLSSRVRLADASVRRASMPRARLRAASSVSPPRLCARFLRFGCALPGAVAGARAEAASDVC